MDKPIEEWTRRLRGMEPKALQKTWITRADDDLSWVHECNFHAAVAYRFKQIGNLAIDVDEDARQKLCIQANSILQRLQNHLRNEPEKLATINSRSLNPTPILPNMAPRPPAITCMSRA